MAETGNQVTMGRIYVKDISFESPATPEILRQRVDPRIELKFGVTTRPLEDERHEVVLSVTVAARTDERTVFLCEVQQAGAFGLRGTKLEDRDYLLNVFCPTQLFPFLREVVADVTGRGGFSQVLLAPVSFEEMYATTLRSAAGQA